MNRDHAFDQLAKAVAEGTITRRTAIAAFAGAAVTSTYRGRKRYRAGAKPFIGAAPAVSVPDCHPILGTACDLLCGIKISACLNLCAVTFDPACAACLKAAYDDCDNCPDKAWACTCPGGASPCNGAIQDSGSPGPCCDPGQTCFPPGICQGPCDQCHTVTIVGCLPNCGQGFCCNHKCCGGTLCCNDQCVNGQTDNNNCGSCGNACTGGQTCQNGSCTCPGSQIFCNNQCVPESDPSNCGGCGNVCTGCTQCTAVVSGSGGTTYQCTSGCSPTQTCCSNGPLASPSCVDTQTDPNNCGGCGTACSSGVCCTEACVPPGGQCCPNPVTGVPFPCDSGEDCCGDQCILSTNQCCGAPNYNSCTPPLKCTWSVAENSWYCS